MNDISQKLDGNIDKGEARATGQMHCAECARTSRRSRCPVDVWSEDQPKKWIAIAQEALNDASDMPSAIGLSRVLQDKYDDYYRHCRARVPVRKTKKHAGHELGARIFTLTYSPKWFDDTTARTTMIAAIERLVRYYKNEMIDFKAVGEVGKNGLSHIHGYYLLNRGKKMTDKNFKRAWDHWNPHKKMNGTGTSFEGGHHDLCKVESDYAGYITKEKNVWYEYNHAPQGNSSDSEASDEEEDPSPSANGTFHAN